MSKTSEQSSFSLSGKFLSYTFEEGYKIKRLTLETPEGNYSIKVTKQARAKLQETLLPGDWIEVRGRKKIDSATATLKLKADWIRRLAMQSVSAPTAPAKSEKMSILVCQKSGCMKRGGKAMCKALEAAIADHGLQDQVTIKGTGCMKNCGKGPNIVFMPGKIRYTKVSAKDIAALVGEHFTFSAMRNSEGTVPVVQPLIAEHASVEIAAKVTVSEIRSVKAPVALTAR